MSTDMRLINGYYVPFDELNTEQSGNSKWCFAYKNNCEFFFKELLNPVYPLDPSALSKDAYEESLLRCKEFEKKYYKFYETINNASCGNLVRIEDFFRFDSKYYVVMERVEKRSLPASYMAHLPLKKKLFLLITIANCFYRLHDAGIVHLDVRPANILIKKMKIFDCNFTAKLIDFDAGRFIGEELGPEDCGGDFTYIAPEILKCICTEESFRISDKADIFSMGLIFHEYCTANLPGYDTDNYDYPCESVLNEDALYVDMGKNVPPELNELVRKMLDLDPEKRPSAESVLNELHKIAGTSYFKETPHKDVSKEDEKETKNGSQQEEKSRVIFNFKN